METWTMMIIHIEEDVEEVLFEVGDLPAVFIGMAIIVHLPEIMIVDLLLHLRLIHHLVLIRIMRLEALILLLDMIRDESIRLFQLRRLEGGDITMNMQDLDLILEIFQEDHLHLFHQRKEDFTIEVHHRLLEMMTMHIILDLEEILMMIIVDHLIKDIQEMILDTFLDRLQLDLILATWMKVFHFETIAY